MISTQKTNIAPSKIIGVQFSLLSPEEIRRNSVVEVVKRHTYINNKPVIGGLFDPRMGVSDPGYICPTDGHTYIDTPGYFGHIELARPVFFIQYLKDIMKISRCVCFKCSKLLLNKNSHKHILRMTPEERWEYVSVAAAKFKRCGDDTEDGCGYRQPTKIKVEGMANLYAYWELKDEETIKNRLTPEIVLKIFKRISDEDVNFMGFSSLWSRPDWMICQVLPVPPPAVRPSVKHDAQQRSEDDLTHIYSNIIRTNDDLKKKLNIDATKNKGTTPEGTNNVSSNAIECMTSLLQYFIAMIVNNKVKGADPLAQRSGRPLQCIMGRINSKTGRIRGNLMGKRVDFSARSVITGDPNLSMRELGVPMKIAMNITKPVMVNDLNRNFLLKLIQNGPDKHPGAKILKRKNGDDISLRYIDRTSIQLENGDIVHRHMMDGDAVLFNRQPSLHRMSMMCHIVKIMKKADTFRFNLAATKNYNADFDGDEMNMHMPQNLLAETELRHLAATPYQIVSPTNNSPTIGIFQDSLLGSYRFTRPNTKLTPRQAMNLLMSYKNVNVEEIRKKTETNSLNSFDVLSQIMPPLTLKYKTKLFEDNEDPVTSNNILEIRNGKYIRGQIEKSVFASGTKGIIHRSFNDFGHLTTADFIDDLQNVINEYMKISSFSVGISDLVSDKKTWEKISQVILKKKGEVQSVINQIHLGVFKNVTANSNIKEFELRVNNILNDATKDSGKMGRDSLSRNNRFLMIVNSGSKGDVMNISQMISCLGQQNIEGKRVPYGFENRTLPHFTKFDDTPNARGFIDNSYISGLTATELFFHSMAGRIGLIDTAIKTASTGYVQRRLIKGLEDIKVEYDMTVRNSSGKIIQFSYGEDGFDSTKTESQIVPLVEMSVEDIYTHYDILGLNDYDKDLLNIYTKATISRIKKQKQSTKDKCLKYIRQMIDERDNIVEKVFRYKNETNVVLPVSFQHIIVNTQGELGLNATTIIDITPLEAFELIEEYYAKIDNFPFVKSNRLFRTLYFFHLSPRDLLVNRRFYRKALVLLLENILLKFKKALVHPGEMVGIISGQSIGEPSTQLTLNTFHGTGIASKSNVTRGVPRIEELLRLTKNPKNPSITVFLKHADEENRERASYYSKMIEYTKLVDVVKSVVVCFDPNENNTVIEEDQLLLKQYYEFEKMVGECLPSSSSSGDVASQTKKSKWIVRLELDQTALLSKNVSMDDIHFAIKNSHQGENLTCIYSDYNSDKLVFRIRPNANIFSKNVKRKGQATGLDQSDDIYLIKNFQENLLNNIVLKGISGIENVLPRNNKNVVGKQDSKFIRKNTWVLDTTGSNLMDVLALDFIDYRKTYSNDVRETFNVLGIEAARQVLHNEMVEVMEFSGVYINYHHLSLLCDRMTCNKNMVEIFRSGLLSDKTVSPISKSTFEVHTEVLLNSARHSEFDPVNSVSANVLLGQHGKFGTNLFNLVLDMEQYQKQGFSGKVDMTDTEEEIEKSFQKSAENKEGNMCSKNKIELKNHLENIRNDTHSNTTSSVLGENVCDDDEYDMGF